MTLMLHYRDKICKGSGWIIDVSYVRKVIHPLLWGVAASERIVAPSTVSFRVRCTSLHILTTSSSVASSYFILVVPMRMCLGKHSCMSSTFPTAILNFTCFFHEAVYSFLGRSLSYQKLDNNNYYYYKEFTLQEVFVHHARVQGSWDCRIIHWKSINHSINHSIYVAL